MRKTIVIFTSEKVDKLVKKNYTFSLRIKSNFDSPLIQNKYRVKYIKITDLSWRTMRDTDIFVFYKAQFFLKSIVNLISVIKKLGKTVLFDMDDYYLDLPDYSSSRHLNEGCRRVNMVDNIERSDLVVVSTSYLRNQFLKYNKNTFICENTIYTDDFKKPIKNSSVINILITSGDNLKLNSFKDDFLLCLKNIKKKFGDNVVLYFLGKFSNVENISQIADHVIDKLSPSRYLEFIREKDFHIGLVPLGAEEDPDTLVSHSSKSNIKFLEFAANGIAGVYSDIEPYKMIETGYNGILVKNNLDDWYYAVEKIICDYDLRERIVQNSQKVVKEKYSKEISQNKWLKLLDNLSLAIQDDKNISFNIIDFIKLQYCKLDYHINLFHQKFLFIRMLIRSREYREIGIRILNIFRAFFK
ncbi:MAG TPA: glycosyltransferase [Spirochaetota bacterium]|nr:glycosyltransferase [Spirochaetota bacterium]HOR43360.1 glycosyltransferase [Spirochaetota bacterium]HPK54891.1 glycosyltransferase [Spirochaetota bacterium]